jgi:hypothetical protein
MLILVLIWWALTQTAPRPPWPELLALLGFLGLVLFRTSWGHLFWLLPAIGLSARLWQGSHRLWSWWNARRPAPAIDAGGEPPA